MNLCGFIFTKLHRKLHTPGIDTRDNHLLEFLRSCLWQIMSVLTAICVLFSSGTQAWLHFPASYVILVNAIWMEVICAFFRQGPNSISSTFLRSSGWWFRIPRTEGKHLILNGFHRTDNTHHPPTLIELQCDWETWIVFNHWDFRMYF